MTIPSHVLKLDEKSIPIVEKTKQSLESLESTKIPIRKEVNFIINLLIFNFYIHKSLYKLFILIIIIIILKSSFSSISRTPKLGPAIPNLIVDK